MNGEIMNDEDDGEYCHCKDDDCYGSEVQLLDCGHWVCEAHAYNYTVRSSMLFGLLSIGSSTQSCCAKCVAKLASK